MKIIGHRGAAKVALENTLTAIQRAIELGVDGVEIDVRLTADKKFILWHDNDLSRIAGEDYLISQHSYRQLADIKLPDDERLALLTEALKLIRKTPHVTVVIEVKIIGVMEHLLKVIDGFADLSIVIASFHRQEINELKKLRPGQRVFLAENSRPFEILHLAHQTKADGLDLNFWLLNPLVYWLARRRGLIVMVYTVDSLFIAWFIKRLYPEIWLCTNNPDKVALKKLTHV